MIDVLKIEAQLRHSGNFGDMGVLFFVMRDLRYLFADIEKLERNGCQHEYDLKPVVEKGFADVAPDKSGTANYTFIATA